jgi:hypothetical protein
VMASMLPCMHKGTQPSVEKQDTYTRLNRIGSKNLMTQLRHLAGCPVPSRLPGAVPTFCSSTGSYVVVVAQILCYR